VSMFSRLTILSWLLVLAIPGRHTRAAELAVTDLVLLPGTTNDVVVSGQLDDEATFGVTVVVEIVPRTGSTGTVLFTASPPVDISPLDDPWPGVGTFTRYDTQSTASMTLNGSVDDNGTFIAEPTTFSGELVRFPIAVSSDAHGVWDMLLSTSPGDSNWQGLPTTLRAGIIRVETSIEVPSASTWSLCLLCLSLLVAATVILRRSQLLRRPV